MTTMSDHTHKAFDSDLQDRARMVAEMGGLAEKQIADSVDALAKRDTALAQRVTSSDASIDDLQREIEEKAVNTIARRQPMAVDLRDVIGALRLANDLERIGDLAKNIAKRVVAISERGHSVNLVRGIDHLGDLALAQLKEVLDAFGSRTVTRINMVRDRDDEIDARYTSLFRELLTYMMEDPRNITGCTHLLFIAKNVERMGDHATNIAETVHYQVKGVRLPDERPRGDDPSFAIADGSS